MSNAPDSDPSSRATSPPTFTDHGLGIPYSQNRSRKLKGWWPQPSTRWGALFYAVLGSSIVWLLVYVLSHVDISISWH